MKNYKFLVPLVLIIAFVGSFYMLYDAKSTTQNRYNEYLSEARKFRELGIIDAEQNYKNALDLNPSLELYIEIGEFYRENGQAKKAMNWGGTILDVYPKEPKAYEFQMDNLMDKEDYIACFKLFDEFAKRKLTSEKISNYISSIEYNFYFSGEYTDVGIFSGGLCPVLVGDKWGYVNTVGDKAISTKFYKVGAFSGELSPVIDAEGNAFFVDKNGNKKFVIVGVENVKELGLIEEGIYSLYNGNTWGFYDQEYNHLFGEYDEVSSIGNGVAAVKKDGKWVLVNREGQTLIDKNYVSVVMDEKLVVYRNGRSFVNEGNGFQMIDSNGAVYGDEVFQSAHLFNDTTYAAVMLDGKWGFVDANGQIVIEPKYEDARSFANGYAAVKENGKWGFINAEGQMVIAPQFENAKDFNDHGCVFVIRSGEWELLRLFKYNY